MSKIKLTQGGFTLIPEGVHVFKVIDVEYKEDFGKMTISLQTKDGLKHTERFSFIKANGEVNQGALNAFSYFAKTALNNYNVDEIDDQDLLGCYIKATVTHDEYESNKEPGKMLKSCRLNEYAAAAGFENSTSSANTAQADNADDLDDLDDFLDD